MARFINTRKAVSEIEDLIRSAKEKLILLSPYLKISKDFRELLEFRNSKDKITTVIFGKQELNPDQLQFLKSLQFVSLKYCDSLHAKCYVNDEKMIITSLNLYEFSMANNKEMGVLIDKNDPNDLPLYTEAMNEIEFVLGISQKFDFFSNKTDNKSTSNINKISNYKEPAPSSIQAAKPNNKELKGSGYCIRTGVEIPFNLEKPFSYESFKKWKEYGDPTYPEKYCHFSGEPSNGETSAEKPILKKNWKKAKDIFNF